MASGFSRRFRCCDAREGWQCLAPTACSPSERPARCQARNSKDLSPGSEWSSVRKLVQDPVIHVPLLANAISHVGEDARVTAREDARSSVHELKVPIIPSTLG